MRCVISFYFSAILTLKSSAGLFYLSCFNFFDSNFIFSERLSLLSSFLILILTHNPLPILICWSILLCGTNLSTSVFPTVVKVLWEQKFCFDHIAIYPKITVSTQYTQKMSFHPNVLCAIYSTVWIPSSHLGYSNPPLPYNSDTHSHLLKRNLNIFAVSLEEDVI